jgi:glycosyltransferase involved in cell wall biosynthesis
MPNPYPYIKTCTIYAQTSRKEGFGLSIAEARLLNRPVVTTEYDGVYVQMVPDKNGIVTKIDAVSVADAIEDLLNNPGKREAISNYQRSEKKGNPEELQKFYSLIER